MKPQQQSLFDKKDYSVGKAVPYDRWSRGAQWHGTFNGTPEHGGEIHTGTLAQSVDRIHSLAQERYLNEGEGDHEAFKENVSESSFHPIRITAPEVTNRGVERFKYEVLSDKHEYREDAASMTGSEEDDYEDREPKFSIGDMSPNAGPDNVHTDRTANAMQAHGYFDTGQHNGPTTIKYRNDHEGQWPGDSKISQVTDRAGAQTYGDYLDHAESQGKRVGPVDRIMAGRGTRPQDLGGQFRSLLSGPYEQSNIHLNAERTSPWQPKRV